MLSLSPRSSSSGSPRERPAPSNRPSKKAKAVGGYSTLENTWEDLKDDDSRAKLFDPLKGRLKKAAVLEHVTLGKLRAKRATIKASAVSTTALFEGAGPQYCFAASAADAKTNFGKTFLKKLAVKGSIVLVPNKCTAGQAAENTWYIPAQAHGSSQMPDTVVRAHTTLTDHSSAGALEEPAAALIPPIRTDSDLARKLNRFSPGHVQGKNQWYTNIGVIGPPEAGKSQVVAKVLKTQNWIRGLDTDDAEVKAFLEDTPHANYKETVTHFVSLKSRDQFELAGVTSYGQYTQEAMAGNEKLHDNMFAKFATPIFLNMDDTYFLPVPFTVVDGDTCAGYVKALQSKHTGTLHQAVIEDADVDGGALASKEFQDLFSKHSQRDKCPVCMCAHKSSDWTQHMSLTEWKIGSWWHVLSGNTTADCAAIGVAVKEDEPDKGTLGWDGGSIAGEMADKFKRSSSDFAASKAEADTGKKKELEAAATAYGRNAVELYCKFIETCDKHDAVFMDLSDGATMPFHAYGRWDSNFFCLKKEVCADDAATMNKLIATTGQTQILDFIAKQSPPGLPLYRSDEDFAAERERTTRLEGAMQGTVDRVLPKDDLFGSDDESEEEDEEEDEGEDEEEEEDEEPAAPPAAKKAEPAAPLAAEKAEKKARKQEKKEKKEKKKAKKATVVVLNEDQKNKANFQCSAQAPAGMVFDYNGHKGLQVPLGLKEGESFTLTVPRIPEMK